MADPGTPPAISGMQAGDTSLDPGATRNFRVNVIGVDEGATVSFSGSGVTGTIIKHRPTWVPVQTTADISALAGPRALTIVNPDTLSDTLDDAITVTGTPPPPPVGDATGTVYDDTNGNGLYDTNEVGLANVTVTITDATTQTHTLTTGPNGTWTHTELPERPATITTTDPTGWTLTTANNPHTITITAATQTTAQPIGYQPPSTDLVLPGLYAETDVHFVFDARSLQLMNGDAVQSWIDDVAGFDLTAPNNTPPTFDTTGFDGLPAVAFDGIDDVLETTFGELNTGDFVYHLVLETITYNMRTAILTRRAGAPLSAKNVIGYDDYDEGGILNGEPAWVTFSGPSGTQNYHYHPILTLTNGDTRTSPTGDTVDDANRVVLTYAVNDSGQIRFWDRLDDLLNVTMSDPGNNLSEGFRLGARENNKAYGNFRLAYIIAVDAASYSEDDYLAAATDLGLWFNVPGFGAPPGAS